LQPAAIILSFREIEMTKHVTVEIDDETLARAEQAGLDLSEVLTRAIRRATPARKTEAERKQAADAWYRENKEAIDASNELMEKHGLFSDGGRMF
jgi:post-segregation antitoxin (ccd killing protein)